MEQVLRKEIDRCLRLALDSQQRTAMLIAQHRGDLKWAWQLIESRR